MEAAELGTEPKTVSKMLKDKTDTSLLLHMLSLVFHTKSRVLVLEKLKSSSETGHIMPILKFFTIYQVAASSNLAPRKEENALLPGTSARPADVLIPSWTGGRDTALDVTVVSPLLTERVDLAITSPGHTLVTAFNDKCRDYLQACEREGLAFIPLPVETLGGWHKKAVEQLKKLARALARSTGKEEEVEIRHLFQRLGILLVKGNAALLLNRIPSFPLPEIDGEM